MATDKRFLVPESQGPVVIDRASPLGQYEQAARKWQREVALAIRRLGDALAATNATVTTVKQSIPPPTPVIPAVPIIPSSGNTILSGDGPPSFGLGTNGDYYVDLTGGRFYGPKTGGNWGSGFSLIGAQGNPGDEGPQGPPGEDVHGAQVWRSIAQSIPDDTLTAVVFDSQEFDTAEYFSHGQPTRFTVPGGYFWLVQATLAYDTNGTGIREAYVRVNGDRLMGLDRQGALSGAETALQCGPVIQMPEAGYFELVTRQTSGGPLDLLSLDPISTTGSSPLFSLVRLGPLSGSGSGST